MNENKTVDERANEICEKLKNFDAKKYAPASLAFLDLLASCAVVKSNIRPLAKVFLLMGLFDDMDRQFGRQRERSNMEPSNNTIGFASSNDESTFTDKEVLGFRA